MIRRLASPVTVWLTPVADAPLPPETLADGAAATLHWLNRALAAARMPLSPSGRRATWTCGNEDDEQLWLAATLEMDGRHAEAVKTLAAFMTRHPGLRVDGGTCGC